MKKKTVDRIFMLMYGVVGFVNCFLSASSFNKIHESCDSNLIRGGLTTILVVSAVLITVAITYMLCNWRGGQCYTQDGDNEASEMYMYISAFVSAAQVTLLSTMISKMKGGCAGEQSGATSKDKSDGKTLKFNLWAMLILNILVLLGSLGGLWYISSYIPGQVRGKKEKTGKKEEKTGKKEEKTGKKEEKNDDNWWAELFKGDDDE